jgi:hypothetical protein
MTGEPKKRSEHEREPDEYESGSVNMQFIEIRQGLNDIDDIAVCARRPKASDSPAVRVRNREPAGPLKLECEL